MINAIYPYNPGSESARLLAEALDVPRIKHRGSRFRGSRAKTVINWGTEHLPDAVSLCRIINNVGSVHTARCKMRTFAALKAAGNIRIPEYTNNRQVARGWLRDGDVCIRHSTTGHEGYGLKIVSQGDLEAFDRERVAPLYTKYVKKKDEYRVHVIGDTTYTQRKLRKNDAPADGDRKVRNTANGYVFSGRFEPPADVVAQAVSAVKAVGLDFAAVDVVWNRHYQQAWVLELNTAPGIEGRTVEVYAEALRRLVG
jgi:glutathione synthase/RimK-type ligase-like ATP-grasp enzyme